MKKIILLAVFIGTILAGCKKDPVAVPKEEYDRKAMLIHWADNIIVPAHKAYNTRAKTLHTQAEVFFDEPSLANLEVLRDAWLESYKAWQQITFFLLGKGHELDVLISLYSNSNPTEASEIDLAVESGIYDLSLRDCREIQGLPALDYLLYGLADTDEDILAYYTTHEHAVNYKQYIVDLAARLSNLSDVVYNDWTSGGYRDKSVNDNRKSVNSLVNDFVHNFMYYIQLAKVSFPAGVCATCRDKTYPAFVEAPYSGKVTKILLLAALDATQDFYNGVPFGGGSPNENGTSLYHYFDFLGSEKDGVRVCDQINNNFYLARIEIEKISNDFVSEIEINNPVFVNINEQLQLNQILLKTCMMDAMNIPWDTVIPG